MSIEPRPRTALLVFGLCLATLVAHAQAPAPTVDEVRATARSLLQSLCGSQCDVIDVQIKKKPAAPRGAVAPGFDETPASRKIAASIELKLLLDKKLPATFRTFVAERVRHRIGEMGLPVTVATDVVPFPARPEPPPEPVAAPVPAQPPPPIIVQPPAAPPPATPVAPEPVAHWDALIMRMIEALPLLMLAGLLGLALIFVLRRFEALTNLAFAPETEAATPTVDAATDDKSAMPLATARADAPTVEAVAEAYRQHRSGARRVFRRLLLSGDYDTVARSVSLIGAGVVRDLMHDPDARQALGALGRRTAEVLRAPMADDDKAELLQRLDAELLGDRVAHRGRDVRPELEELLGFGPEAFAALVRRLAGRLSLVALRHAPPHLTESYLAGLTSKQRATKIEELLLAPAATPEEVAALAEAVGREADAAKVDGEEAERVVDLLDALPANEQDALVEALQSARPDFVRRNLGQLPVESALSRVPAYALAAAWSTVPFDDWISYLRGAPEDIRARAIAACPTRLRDSLDEELHLRVKVDARQATDARRRIVRAALHAAPTAGNGATGPARGVEDEDTAIMAPTGGKART